MEIKAGANFCSQEHPENWLHVEEVFPDGSFLVSFPGKPENGTATIEPEQWRELSEKFGIIRAPLSL